jgi:polyisoprenoid-binding protein YceI
VIRALLGPGHMLGRTLGALLLGGCSEFAEGLPRAELGPLVRTGTVSLGRPPPPAPSLRSIPLGPDELTVDFEAAKLSGRHRGRFERTTGRLELDPGRLHATRLLVDIETASVVSDTPKLTRHLKSEDFFGVETHPRARLWVEELRPLGEARYRASGSLELRGIRRDIAFPVRISLGAERVRGKSTFVLDRKAFGIVYAGRPDDLIASEVILRVAVDAPLAPRGSP